jgi:hypothetical protein
MLLQVITVLVDQAPEPKDVKAGPVALLIFLGLIAAVVFLGFSLFKQLRKAQAADEAGVYDDPGEKRDAAGPDERPASPDPT